MNIKKWLVCYLPSYLALLEPGCQGAIAGETDYKLIGKNRLVISKRQALRQAC